MVLLYSCMQGMCIICIKVQTAYCQLPTGIKKVGSRQLAGSIHAFVCFFEAVMCSPVGDADGLTAAFRDGVMFL